MLVVHLAECCGNCENFKNTVSGILTDHNYGICYAQKTHPVKLITECCHKWESKYKQPTQLTLPTK